MDWIISHGSKLTSLLLTLLTAANGLDGQQLTDLMGDAGKRWVAFALAAATLAHTTLLAPRSTGQPRP